MQEIPIRYSSMPTKFDLAPYEFLVKVLRDDADYDYYIQVSKDETISEWISMPDYLDKLLRPYYTEESFRKKLQELQQNQCKKNGIDLFNTNPK